MSVLAKLMELVSLRKVCDAVDKEEIYTLQRGVIMAKEANGRLAPNPQVFNSNQSRLAKAEELLNMKETVLKEEARLKELVAARERLLQAQTPPEHVIKAKEVELQAITRFVREYQQYRKTCPSLSRTHDAHCPNQHRCKSCAIDEESDEEDGPLFKKKRATPENPRGSLELHLSDKVYYYLVEKDEMIVIDRDDLSDGAESSISCTETEITESVLSVSETEISESDGESTVCADSFNTKFYSPSCSEYFDLDKLKELINESRKTDKRLDEYRKHVIGMCQRHKAEERMFRQTTNELLSRYGIDRNFNVTKPSERVNYHKNSSKFCPTHSPKPMRGSFDDARRPMRGSFDDARRPMRRSFEDARKPMRGSFDDARRPMRGSFDDARRPMRESFDDARRPMRESFDDARRPMRGSFDDARRSARFASPKKSFCENCVMKKFMSERINLQRPSTSSYSSARPPMPWSAPSNPLDLNAISSSFQHALWPKSSKRQRYF